MKRTKQPTFFVTNRDGDIITMLENQAEKGNHYFDESFFVDVETGYQTLEMKFYKNTPETQNVKELDYINFEHPNGERFGLIINYMKENDQYKEIIAETIGIELLNGEVPTVETTEGVQTLGYWVRQTLGDWSHWNIGTNESNEKKFFDVGQAESKFARIQRIAKLFNVEASFSVGEDFQERFINFKRARDEDPVGFLDSDIDLIEAEREVDTSNLVTRLVLEPKTVTEEITKTKDVKKVVPVKEKKRTVVETDDRVDKAIAAANGRRGIPYVFGGATASGLDCSGLVWWAYRQAGINFGRSSTTVWYNNPAAYNMKRVNSNQVQKGDLVFMDTGWTSRKPNHVGIVTNPATKEFIHIYNSRVSVTVNKWTQAGWNKGLGFLRLTAIKDDKKVTVVDEVSGDPVETNNPNAIHGATNQEKIFNKLKSYGMTDDAVFAIMGNIGQETDGTYNPEIKQYGGGPGRGLIQWSVNERWAQLVKWCRSRSLNEWSINGQLRYLVEVEMRDSWFSSELKRYAKVYGVPVSGSGYDSFIKGTGIERLVYTFERAIERAGIPHYDSRVRYANDAKAKFGGSYNEENEYETVYEGEYIETETTTERVDKKIHIEHVEYDDGRYFTLAGQNSVSSHLNSKYRFAHSTNVYIEEYYATEETNPEYIVQEMVEALRGRDEPVVTYKIQVDNLKDEIRYGSYVTIIFRDWNPDLYLEARVTGLSECFTEPSKNSYTISNYKILTGTLKSDYQMMMDVAKRLEEQIEDVGEPTILIESMYGESFKPDNTYTELKVTLNTGGKDVTDRYSATDYIWERGVGYSMEGGWQRTGYVIEIDEDDYLDDKTTFKVTDRTGRSAYITLNKGAIGESAYEVAVNNGFTGTEEDWLESLKGTPGKNGVGVKGDDGRTQYLHIAYSNSGDGSVEFSIDDPIGKDYIGVYRSFSEEDPLDWTLYEWSLFKGEEGDAAVITNQTLLSDGQIKVEWSTGQITYIPKGEAGSNANAYNLIKDGNAVFTSRDFFVAEYNTVEPLKEGETYTLSLRGTKPESQDFGIWQNGATTGRGSMTHIGDNLYQLTFNSAELEKGFEDVIRIYQPPAETAGRVEIEWVTLVKGLVGTEYWLPAVVDIEGSINNKVGLEDFNRIQGRLDEIGNVAVTEQQFGEISQALLDYKEMLDNEVIELDAAQSEIEALLERNNFIENELGDLAERWTFLDTQITLSEAGVFVGDTVKNTGVRVADDRVDFVDGGEVVAWITNETLHIRQGILTDTLTVGEHTQETLANGVTTWRWTGTQTPSA